MKFFAAQGLLATLCVTLFTCFAAASDAAKPEIRDPAAAIANLDVHEDLAATLFAAEPMMLSPSNIDIDQRGRIWMCEIVNYRGHRNRRPEGDRILILEDTDLDGTADKSTVFYQGRDIDSPHGICVLPTPSGKGTRAIVSAGPHVLILTDTDGDDRADKTETLFNGINGSQHDHGIHAFVFGPDGKFYFNFGNAGERIDDRDGNRIVDKAGNRVEATRKPYQQGMVFRCNTDGSEFETLAWNFRNNWMVTVDSFGTMWQSDNDDDGNRGVRINYVMEFGNYGYRDELTGAGWHVHRTGGHPDRPLQHWHLRDPGVVPNLLQTGAGSPTGITIYEGSLLPKVFQNQILHTDAGPNICRAYPAEDDGAGYRAKMVDILHGARDQWFRPADVSVAPDGSLFVADWYDPGVGGHQAASIDSGRMFRVAPPGVKYTVPQFDFSTAEGAAEALKNPNYAVRYTAWTALHGMGHKAETALLRLWNSRNPRYRARALWLLGKIPGHAQEYVDLALEDDNPNIRIVALRLARQTDVGMFSLLEQAKTDESSQVRREVALAIRDLSHGDLSSVQITRLADIWAELAVRHDGRDRWYLEALGIAAERFSDQAFVAWVRKVGDDWNTKAGRDIVWRSRSHLACRFLAMIIIKLPADQQARYFRAFDFHTGSQKEASLQALFKVSVRKHSLQTVITATVAEAALRLPNLQLDEHPESKRSLLDYLKQNEGTLMYFMLVEQFKLIDQKDVLTRIALANPDNSVGRRATRVLVSFNILDALTDSLNHSDEKTAIAAARVLNFADSAPARDALAVAIGNPSLTQPIRAQAVRALVQSKPGAMALLEIVEQQRLPKDVNFVTADVLLSFNDGEIRDRAKKYLSRPQTADRAPLPPVAELVRQRGDIAAGSAIYRKQGTCINCHKIAAEGKLVGPDLTEIGGKLSREAMYAAILAPSAGISHNYENYQLLTTSGRTVSGVLVNRTEQETTLRDAEAVEHTFAADEIDIFQKSEVSLMPADLQRNLKKEDLINLVEYLMTLKPKKM